MEDSQIRSVARALSVLRLMNTAQRWTLHELNQRLDLPKSTLFRILSTLQSEGYVHGDVARGQYGLTRKVRELGGGYTEQAEVVSAGASIAIRVTREIKWPLAIGVRDSNKLVVGFSTMPYSPVAVHATTIGHGLSLENSAMGLAYLAFCSAQERHIILELLQMPPSVTGGTAPTLLESRIAEVASQGYAVRQPAKASESATLAVPISLNGFAIASLGMTTFGSLMTRRTIAQFLPVLLETATEISVNYSHWNLGEPQEAT